MIPGSNLLALALTVIAPQGVQFYQATGRAKNAVGQFVTAYAAPVTIPGSFQPVDVKLLQKYGLDMDKDYATFYATGGFETPTRNESGDQFAYGGRRWQAIGKVPWVTQDGWTSILMVDVGPDA